MSETSRQALNPNGEDFKNLDLESTTVKGYPKGDFVTYKLTVDLNLNTAFGQVLDLLRAGFQITVTEGETKKILKLEE